MRVHPDYQGRGFGQIILSHLERRARELGYRVLCLDTTLQQMAARHLYEKNGYLPAGERDVRGFQCLLYEKPIDGNNAANINNDPTAED